MCPRPLFYLQPYSVGITVPKEMGASTGLKTATTSSVFVTVHYSPDPLTGGHKYYIAAACNKQEGCRKKSYEAVYCFGFWGPFLWFKRSPETGADSSWAETWRSRAKFLSYVTAYGTFSHATGLNSQSKGPAPPLESNHCWTNMSTPEFICIG